MANFHVASLVGSSYFKLPAILARMGTLRVNGYAGGVPPALLVTKRVNSSFHGAPDLHNLTNVLVPDHERKRREWRR